MRIATWNVNSIRSRIDRVEAWLERAGRRRARHAGDQVPRRPVPRRSASRRSATRSPTYGLSQWNGVAIVSRVGLADVQVGFDGMPGWGEPLAREARAIGATCGGVRVWSLYVPNGRDARRPAHGLQARLAGPPARRRRRLARRRPRRPDGAGGRLERRAARRGRVGHGVLREQARTSPPPERAAFQAVVDAGYTDVARPYTPARAPTPTGTTRSCASPRSRACGSTSSSAHRRWPAGSSSAEIDREERKGKGASDHAPVIVDLVDASDADGRRTAPPDRAGARPRPD